MKGKAIIRGVMAFYKISADEFFGRGRSAYLSHARMVAILQMTAAGFPVTKIARLMKRDHGSIIYWQKAERREKRRQYYAQYHVVRSHVDQKRISLGVRTTKDQRRELLRLRREGMRQQMYALQEKIGLPSDYTDKLSYTRTTKRLNRVGPEVPILPAGFLWNATEDRV